MGTPLSVLIVEDSEDDALLLLREIQRGGYDPTFERVDTPQAMKVALDKQKWDIIISDYVMPHFSGLAALELLQRNNLDMPFIIVSGNIGEDMAADAMRAGANDYVMKSNLSRLTPAIKRELREAVVRQERKRAEEALQKSESLLQLQINRMPIGCILWNSEFCIGSWNPAAEEIFGFKADEVLGKHPYSLIVPKDVQPQIDIIWRRLLEGDTIAHSVNENITKDGRIIICSWSNTPLKEADGTVIGVLSMVQDITERKLSEAALRESEERFRKLVQYSPDAIAIHSEGKIVFINAAGVKLFGAANSEQLVGKPVTDFVHPDYREIVRERIRLMREEGKNVPLAEEKFIRLDGSVVDVEVAAIPFTYKGKPGMQVIIRDITGRKRAEETLQQSEEKYRTLIDNIQDGVFIFQDTKLQFANEAFARVGGYTVEEVIGKDLKELVAPEDFGILLDRHRRRQAGEDVPHEYEIHMMHKDGRTRILVNTNVGLITYHGRVANMGTVKDITEKKKLESQLLRAQRMESIGTLAGGIAHDLNNVLTPMMLSLQILKENHTDEQSQKLLSILEKNSQRGADLIKQVLTFARGIEGERKSLQIKHIITETEKVLKETFPRNIEIKTGFPKDLSTISGDTTQLHQVIMNLCVNARDAMPDGGVLDISADNFLVDENYTRINIEAKVGPYIIITISDNGTGIPAEIMERVFEPFFTTKEHGKGTGIGLSTVQAIVKSHGGFINVYSEVGNGTTFRVYLPAIKTEIPEAEEQKLELSVGNGEMILVAEDESSIREITSRTLEKYGYKVLIAQDGAQAVASFDQNKNKISAVLMDLMMPVMDGEESIQAIRKINPEAKIIAVSGLTEKDRLANIADHTKAFLPKPYTAKKLLRTIHEVISAK